MLPSLSALPVRPASTPAVGAILDDDLPDELLTKIETMVLDERRGCVRDPPSLCAHLQWWLSYDNGGREFTLGVTVRRSGGGLPSSHLGELTRRDYDLMKRSFADVVFGTFSDRKPHPYRRIKCMGRWWDDAPSCWRASLVHGLPNVFMTKATLTAKDGGRTRVGVTRDEMWALITPITTAFAKATGRMVTDNLPLCQNLTYIELCPVRPGEPGFLGRTVSKSLARE